MKQQTNLGYSFPLATGYANFSNLATASVSTGTVGIAIQGCNEVGKYSIYEIANWFLSKEAMTHKKLQKLCYYAQAWFITLKDIRLADTVFEAWIHGPVSPALYDRFKEFGYSKILIKDGYISAVDEIDIELLESVWQTYGDHTGNALESLSHKEQPWISARIGYDAEERCNVPISLDVMKAYYRTIYTGGNVG